MRFYIIVFFLCALTFSVLLSGCVQYKPNVNDTSDNHIKEENSSDNTQTAEGETMTLKITSDAFKNNSLIPAKYTCKGEDVNPPLRISGVPGSAKSLALIADDPDAPAGDWVHWIIINIDPKTEVILENSVPKGATLGKNDFGKNSWGGPCPPSGTHRYFFKLYALDTFLSLGPGAIKPQLISAMDGHVIEKTELVGLFKK